MIFPDELVRVSIAINTLLGGAKGVSVCGQLYANRLDGHKLSRIAVDVVNVIFWFDPDHCRRAYLHHRVEGRL